MLAIVVGNIVSGVIVSALGNYWYFLVFGPWIICVGAGLMYIGFEREICKANKGRNDVCAIGS
jgi:hypothetical protein